MRCAPAAILLVLDNHISVVASCAGFTYKFAPSGPPRYCRRPPTTAAAAARTAAGNADLPDGTVILDGRLPAAACHRRRRTGNRSAADRSLFPSPPGGAGIVREN